MKLLLEFVVIDEVKKEKRTQEAEVVR